MGKGGFESQRLYEQIPAPCPDNKAEIREDQGRYQPPVVGLAEHRPQIIKPDIPE